MKKSGIVAMLIATIVTAQSYAQSSFCDQPGCEQSTGWVTETPGGPVDGLNNVFVVSGTPAPGSQVQVFRNGIALRAPTDFVVNQETISLKPSQVPVQGDILKVMYVPFSDRRASKKIDARGLVDPPANHLLDEITIEAGREALAEEAAGFQHTTESPARTRGRELWVGGPEGQEPASIRLLSRSLQEDRGSPDAKSDLEGVEGTGDHPLASPFDRSDFAAEQSGHSYEAPGASEPASSAVRLLERRSDVRSIDRDTVDDEQFTPKNKKKRLHTHAVLDDIWR